MLEKIDNLSVDVTNARIELDDMLNDPELDIQGKKQKAKQSKVFVNSAIKKLRELNSSVSAYVRRL